MITPPSISKVLLAFIGWMIVLLVILLSVHFALAHDHEHPELNDWYKGLESRKGPCCDGSDAMRLEEPDWESRDGHYRVRLPKDPRAAYDLEANGVWVDVPEEALVKGPNRDGRALVWPMYLNGEPAVRCFMPGLMG